MYLRFDWAVARSKEEVIVVGEDAVCGAAAAALGGICGRLDGDDDRVAVVGVGRG